MMLRFKAVGLLLSNPGSTPTPPQSQGPKKVLPQIAGRRLLHHPSLLQVAGVAKAIPAYTWTWLSATN
eukprot:4570934-Amphidinium_carterae.1